MSSNQFKNVHVSKLSKKTKHSLIAVCCSGLFLRCRAGAPGCGQMHTSSGPPRAPPRGCPGWSAAGPASPASHVRAPAARRSTPSLKYQTGETSLIPLGLQKDYCKGKSVSMAPKCVKIAVAASSLQPDLSNKDTFLLDLFSARNRIFPLGPLLWEVVLPKAWSLPEWKSLRRLRRPPSISLTSETSVRKECCRGEDCTTLLGPAGWGALGFSLWGLGKRQETQLCLKFLHKLRQIRHCIDKQRCYPTHTP